MQLSRHDVGYTDLVSHVIPQHNRWLDATLGGTLAISGYTEDVWDQAFPLMTYTGSISGDFDSITGIPSYLGVDIIAADGTLTFSAIPEPATAGLLGLLTATLFLRRRRR